MADDRNGARRRNGKNAIAEQFIVHPISMLESPAYRVMSLGGHRVMARIEIEHMKHGGADNGCLPVTYSDFMEYGLSRRLIAPALREAEALGFIQTTQRGCAGPAEFRQPSLYRLTFRHAKGETGDGSHEYRKIKTIEQAEAVAAAARMSANPENRARGEAREIRRQKQISGATK